MNRLIYNANIKNNEDAILFLSLISNESNTPLGRMANSLIKTIKDGIEPNDLLFVRLQVVILREDAVDIWGCNIIDSIDELEAFIFQS